MLALGVRPQHRADEQHRCAGRADERGDDRAEREERRVGPRRALEVASEVDAAGDVEEAAQQRDEAGVLVHLHAELGDVGLLHRQPEDRVGGQREAQEQLVEVAVPPVLEPRQRHDGDRQQHHDEEDHHPGRRDRVGATLGGERRRGRDRGGEERQQGGDGSTTARAAGFGSRFRGGGAGRRGECGIEAVVGLEHRNSGGERWGEEGARNASLAHLTPRDRAGLVHNRATSWARVRARSGPVSRHTGGTG